MNLVRAINSLFSKGKVTVIEDENAIQIQQNLLDTNQVRSDLYAPQQYGLETSPHIGADTICLFKGGSTENGYVIKSFEPKHKPIDIKNGDTYLYTGRNSEDGKVHRIWLKEEDGEILIETDANVNVNCKNATVTAVESVVVTAGGDIKLKADAKIVIEALTTEVKGNLDIDIGVSGVATPMSSITFVNGIAVGIQ